MKKIFLLTICVWMFALSYAHTLSTELFGSRYPDAMRNIEAMLGKPTTEVDGKVVYKNVKYEGMSWNEAYFKFAQGVLVEARFICMTPTKSTSLRHLEDIAKVMKQSHDMTKDYEDRHTAFYKGGRSPMEFGHLFTIFVSPYKGRWSAQLRYGPFEF